MAADAAGRFIDPKRSGVSVEFNFQNLREIIRWARQSYQRIGEPIKTVHEGLAVELQSRVAGALEKAIETRGRAQRGEALLDAIQSRQNRRVRQDGFTVGFLGDMEKVSKYYRGLEEGTDVHVGQQFLGLWLTADGKLTGAVHDRDLQIDPRIIRFRGGGPTMQSGEFYSYRGALLSGHKRVGRRRGQMLTIGKPIPAYHYYKTGLSQWQADYPHRDILKFYGDALGDQNYFGQLFIDKFGRAPIREQYKPHRTSFGPTRRTTGPLKQWSKPRR